jgi:PncC family amidohydrolase
MGWFRGGVVAYQSRVKRALLDVAPGPVVTEQTAREMAWGATRVFDADVAVSVTGVAGPEPLDGVEPGVVIIGVAIGNRARSFVHHFCGEPAAVCADAARAALDDLARCLESDEASPIT